MEEHRSLDHHGHPMFRSLLRSIGPSKKDEMISLSQPWRHRRCFAVGVHCWVLCIVTFNYTIFTWIDGAREFLFEFSVRPTYKRQEIQSNGVVAKSSPVNTWREKSDERLVFSSRRLPIDLILSLSVMSDVNSEKDRTSVPRLEPVLTFTNHR